MQQLDYGFEQYQVEAQGFHYSHVQAAAGVQLIGEEEEEAHWDEQDLLYEMGLLSPDQQEDEMEFLVFTQGAHDSHVERGFDHHCENVMESHVFAYFISFDDIPF